MQEYSCFDFPAHSMFPSDVFWGSLGTSIFGNSSSAENNTQSRLRSILSFRFSWLSLNFNILSFWDGNTIPQKYLFLHTFSVWFFTLNERRQFKQ